jgi:hypothetical protein
VILNRVSAAQSVVGKDADTRVRGKLAPWFARERESMTEAEILRACAAAGASNIVYANSAATSIEGLRSSHYADSALFRRMAGRLADNQAKPFAVGKSGAQEVKRYVILAPERGLDELSNDNNWQTLMAQAGDRGAGNYLYSGIVPSWNGSTVLPWTVEVDSANGPQGCFAQPMAFLGEALDFTQTTARTVKGGASAAAAALTDHLYFRFFPGAAFTSHEVTKITQETSDTKYALIQDKTTGKFGMISYTTTTPLRACLTSALLRAAHVLPPSVTSPMTAACGLESTLSRLPSAPRWFLATATASRSSACGALVRTL